jgi:Protein of unknown function (DUF3300)
MITLEGSRKRPRHPLGRQMVASLLSLALFFAALPPSLLAYQDDAQTQAQQAPPQAPAYAQQSPEQLQQLVAPIALYPDSLVAQILAASTFPEQVVEADRWLQEHPDLQGDALAQAADQQPWDPSVKALTAFPSVLGNMDKNLSWTSSLGDAYYNQQQDVMDAIQVVRRQAEQAGNLKTTPQQIVTTEGSTIIIEPASPDVVYAGRNSSRSLSRLLVPHPHAAESQCSGRRQSLHHPWQNDRGFRFRGLSGGVSVVRGDDVHRGARRSRLPKGSRQKHCGSRQGHGGIQPRFELESGRGPAGGNWRRSEFQLKTTCPVCYGRSCATCREFPMHPSVLGANHFRRM